MAGPPVRDAGGQLPQHHAARADGAVGQPSRPGPVARPGGPTPPGAPHRARRRRLRLQRDAPGGGRVHCHSGDPAFGGTRFDRQPSTRHGQRRPTRRRPSAAPSGGARGALARRRAGVAEQGAREHHCRAGRRPGPRRPRRNAGGHRQARDGVLRRRAAPLRGRDGALAGRHLRRPRVRRHRRVGLRQCGRARRHVRARGLLRPRRRGDGRPPARRRLRPGRGAGGVGRRRGAGLRQGSLRTGRRHLGSPGRRRTPGGHGRGGAPAVGRARSRARPPTASSAFWPRWRRPERRRDERASTSSSRCCTAPTQSGGTRCGCARSWWGAASRRTSMSSWWTPTRSPRRARTRTTRTRPSAGTC